MNRKSKFVIAGLGVVALAAGATFAVAEYGKGWRGHGKSLVFGEIHLTLADGTLAAHATTTYALL